LHRREQEALAAVFSLESKMESTSLDAGSSSENAALFPSLSAPQGSNQVHGETLCFPNLSVVSQAAIFDLGAQKQANVGSPSGAHGHNPAFSGGNTLPAIGVANSDDGPSRVGIHQIGELQRETEALLRSIKYIQDKIIQGRLTVSTAGHQIEVQYDHFSQQAASLLGRDDRNNMVLPGGSPSFTWLGPRAGQRSVDQHQNAVQNMPQHTSDTQAAMIANTAGSGPQYRQKRDLQKSRQAPQSFPQRHMNEHVEPSGLKQTHSSHTLKTLQHATIIDEATPSAGSFGLKVSLSVFATIMSHLTVYFSSTQT
jgi:hypothetical protein